MVRCYVRGLGAITPLAPTWAETWPLLVSGACAIRPVTRFDATRFPCTVAAPVEAFLDAEDRRVPMALAAAAEAVRESGDLPGRLGIFVGAESGRAAFPTVLGLAQAFEAGFGEAARGFAHRIGAPVVSPAAPASALARAYGATGPAETFSLACSSGLAAIVEGVRAIRAGECDTALVGGVGADVDPLMLAGFGRLSALSAKGVCRPFDRARDGFVVGEGAAFAVLSADPRGAFAEVAGVGRSLDAHHLTMPEPSGAGALRAMRAALREAGVSAVDAIQAHGTSTPQNDAAEARALREAFGEIGAVTAMKGAVGHWIAGAGAAGFVSAVESLRTGVVPPIAGLTELDPRCGLPVVVGEAMRRPIRSALVNAFAFGGANSSAVLVSC